MRNDLRLGKLIHHIVEWLVGYPCEKRIDSDLSSSLKNRCIIILFGLTMGFFKECEDYFLASIANKTSQPSVLKYSDCFKMQTTYVLVSHSIVTWLISRFFAGISFSFRYLPLGICLRHDCLRLVRVVLGDFVAIRPQPRTLV